MLNIPEVDFKIMSHMGYRDLIKVCKNSSFYGICTDDYFWKSKIQNENLYFPEIVNYYKRLETPRFNWLHAYRAMIKLTNAIDDLDEGALTIKLKDNHDVRYALKMHRFPYCGSRVFIEPLSFPRYGYRVVCRRENFDVSLNELQDFLFTIYYTNADLETGIIHIHEI